MTSSGYPSPLPSPSRSHHSKETEVVAWPQSSVLEGGLLESNASLVHTNPASGYGYQGVSGLLSPSLRQVAQDRRTASDSHHRFGFDPISHGNNHASEDADLARHFGAALKQAKEEGLDLFAQAPQPSFRSTAPGLHPPHGRATGMVQPPVHAYRLNDCLAKDYFDRQPWNSSTVPAPWSVEGIKVSRTAWTSWGGCEDRRSLEAVARTKRVGVMEGQLAKRAGLPRRPASVAADITNLDRASLSGMRPRSQGTNYSQNSRPASRATGRSSRQR
eukprot:TRINITY_DN33290_c0_g2_i1.p1 TRINITY_DN33290_c0_g2~~TRINITY_DN33290_c0_g2_i1.p1  ORF type:complete len:274 (-),score=35.47 TRINITY_DN33290_c0_g2_i1:65-886(-)